MQKGIFFNIVDLKKSLEVRNTRKREFTIVANDYSEHNNGVDDSLNKEHPKDHHTTNNSAENSEIHKSPDHGNSAKPKVYVPDNDHDIADGSRNDAVVAKSPSPQFHDKHSSKDVANPSFKSRDNADVAKSPSPQFHDNHSSNDMDNPSFRSGDDDADAVRSTSPPYHDNHSPPRHNDPYSPASVGLPPDRPDHVGYNPQYQHQPVGQYGGWEPSPAAAGGYHPQYSDPQYSRGDEYGYDDRPSDYQQGAQNMPGEQNKKKSSTCTLL